MRLWIYASVTTIFCLLLGLLALPAVANYYSCDYVVPIEVINNSSTAKTDLRIQFTMGPSSLVDLGMMQPDADDTYLMDGATQLYHTATSLNSGTGTWLGEVSSLGANSRKELNMWLGYPNAGTRSQWWLGDSEDVAFISDSSDLDMPGNVALGVDAYFHQFPAVGEEDALVTKAGNYALYVDGTPSVVFTLWVGTGAATSSQGSPSAAGEYTQLSVEGAASNYEAVNDTSDSTYVYGTSELYDTYETQGVYYGSSITTVTVNIRAMGSPSMAGDFITPLLYSPQTGLVQGSTVSITSSFADYSQVVAWSGGSDIQVGVKTTPNANTVRVSKVWTSVSYTEPGTPTSLSLPIVADTEYTLGAWRDGNNMYLSTGLAQTSGSISGSLFVNDEPLRVVESDGRFRNLVVSQP